MTCIVGLEFDGRIWMGCDSAAVGPNMIYPTSLSKVFTVGGILIGYTSSFRMGQLLQYKLEVPPHDDGVDDITYLATSFVDAVRDCLQAGGFATRENEAETGGNFLVGYHGRLYEVCSDYQVNSTRRGYMAIGAGEEYALGSLHTTDDHWSPVQRIVFALQAAADWNHYVLPPLSVFTDTGEKVCEK